MDPKKIKESIIGITKSGEWDKEYPTCNQFTDEVSKQFFNFNIPRVGGDSFFANNPIGAIHMDKYLGGRSLDKDSGVNAVAPEQALDIANKGGLVYIVGNGHLSIVSPGDALEIYRSKVDADGRPTIGLKDKANWKFYHVDPQQYQQYDKVNPNEYKGDFVSRRDLQASWHRFAEKHPEYKEHASKKFQEEAQSTYDSKVDIDNFVGTSQWRQDRRSMQADIDDITRQ